jgi:nitrogen-specific signal transduction histidine kinase
MVGTFQDITERKQLEAQLREAQKLEAIGQLAAGVAHDFNNLLTIICGYSDILLAQLPADDSKRNFIANIRKAGDRATGLTRQLLAFSRQTIQAPVVLDLNDLVRENERMLARLIGEDVGLITELQPALPRIKVDPGQITQVIMNLAVNARDAMPQGGDLVIHTSTLDVDDELARKHAGVRPGQHVCLTIRDTGTGMSESVLAHLFEPFFTTKELGKGTGLGLAVVFGIAKQAGGFIDVDSEVNVGTTIRVVLPVSVEKAGVALDTGASPGGTETVLLVEDEEQVLEFAALTLQGSGYRLLKAANGKKALALGDDVLRKIDLLVTDVVMPEMSGRQLAERLRQINPRAKVLFVSGYTDDAILRHGVHQADVRILQKPYTPLALAQKVREVLSARP